MPRRKYYKRKPIRRYRRRKVYGRPRYQNWRSWTLGSIAHNAMSGVQYLKGIINSEKKFIDTTVSVNPSTASGVLALNQVAQGDTNILRDGNSLLCKSVHFKYHCDIHASASITHVRLVFVIDKQQVADTAPAWTDLYESVSTNALIKKGTVGRFQVLKDIRITLDAIRGSYTGQVYIPLQLHAKFNGANANDIQKNGLYLFHCSNEATNTPSLAGEGRVQFYDN